MKKKLESNVRIRFQDCDPFNHLNNAKYLDYFINTREDQIAEYYNLNVFEYMKTTGDSWAIGSNQIQYFRPAGTMELVLIETQLLSYSEKSLHVEMKMWNAEKTELKALLWTRFVPFNIKSQKRSFHGPELIELFQKIVLPVDETIFEQRIKSLLSSRN